MSFEGLQKKKLIENYQVTAEEIKSILEAARSDIKTAQDLLNTDICWAFNIAYNSILEAGIALNAYKGIPAHGRDKACLSNFIFKKSVR